MTTWSTDSPNGIVRGGVAALGGPAVFACLVLSTSGDVGIERMGATDVTAAWFRLAASVALAAVVAMALHSDDTLSAALRRHRVLLLAMLAVIGARVASVAAAAQPTVALGAVAGHGLALVVLVALTVLAERDAGCRHVLALGAALMVAGHVLLLTGALAMAAGGTELGWPFRVATHQHTAGLARFYAFGNPFYCALRMLACIGLLGALPSRRWRAGLRWGGAVVIVSTLSFVTLLLPLLGSLPGRRLSRVASAACLCGALMLLYVHPLELHVGGRSHRVGTLHPMYARDGLGPRHMPLHQAGDARLGLRFHWTAYAYLLGGASTCFAEHPLLGVGADNFEASCPVLTMNTYGGWVHTRPHNEYLGQLSEGGLLGALTLGLLSLALLRRCRLVSTVDPIARRALITSLLCGLASPVFFELSFVALLGGLLVHRERGQAP